MLKFIAVWLIGLTTLWLPQEAVRETMRRWRAYGASEADQIRYGRLAAKSGLKTVPTDNIPGNKDGRSALGVDKKGQKGYNISNLKASRDIIDNYTLTDEFLREVPYGMREAFTRSLANKTSGMVEGEVKTIYVVGYIFEADAYMHGHILAPYNEKTKKLLEVNKNKYDRINENRRLTTVWTEAIQNAEGGSSGDSDISRRGRSGADDRLPGETSERYTSGDNERVWPAPRPEEEYHEIVNKVRVMYGFEPVDYGEQGKTSREIDALGNEFANENAEYFKDSNVSSDTRYALSGEDFRQVAWFDGRNTVYIKADGSNAEIYSALLGHEVFHKMFKSSKVKKLFMEAWNNTPEAKRTEVTQAYMAFLKENTDLGIAERVNISNEEVAAAYAQELLNSPDVWDFILEGEPSLSDRIIAFFGGVPKRYAFADGMDAAAKRWLNHYKKLFNEVSALNKGTAAIENAVVVGKLNLSKGEFVNEQQSQDSRILEGRVLSAVSESKNNQRQRSNDTQNVYGGVAFNGDTGRFAAQNNDYRRNSSGYFARTDIVSSYHFKRYQETVLRGLEGKLADRDSSGRRIPKEIKEKFRDTVLKNENGELLSVFHWTSKVFEVFAYGDIGFHFGTYDAAMDRRKGKSFENGADRVKEVYLNITNPIFLEDFGNWDCSAIASQLWEKGLISNSDLARLQRTKGYTDGRYSDDASKAIRKILNDLGYDGIIYQNISECKGQLSVAALYPDQIYTVAEETVNVNNGKSSRELDLIDNINEKAGREDTAELTKQQQVGRAALVIGKKAAASEVKALKGEISDMGIEPGGIVALADSYFDRYGGDMNRTTMRQSMLEAARGMLDSL